jgi:hypothetical protein
MGKSAVLRTAADEKGDPFNVLLYPYYYMLHSWALFPARLDGLSCFVYGVRVCRFVMGRPNVVEWGKISP